MPSEENDSRDTTWGILGLIAGEKIEAVERFVFIRGFQPKVKVVVAQGKKEPIIFLSTDLTLTAAQIIEIYGARFSIELA